MNLKALLEKRGELVRKLEAFQTLDTPTDEQRTAAKADTDALAKIKTEIEDARSVAQAIEDGKAQVTMPAAGVRRVDEPVVEAVPHIAGRKVFTANRYGSRDAADRAALRAGMFMSATMFGGERAVRFCRENGIILTRAQSEGANSDGGYTVPVEFSNELIRLVEEYGVARRFAKIVPMASNTLNQPKRSGGVTAYFVGEAGTLTASAMSFDNVGITAKKLATLVPFSSEVDEDSIIGMADVIAQEVALAFAQKEDDCVFNGTGATAYGGIRGVTNKAAAGSVATATGLTTLATLTDAALSAAFGKLPGYAMNRAIFCHNAVAEQVFSRLARAAGGATIAEFTSTGIVTTYHGVPVIGTQVLDGTGDSGDVYAVIGDLGAAVTFGDRRAISMQRLVELYAATDQQAIKATERFGATYHDVGTSSVAGAVVVCKLG